MPDRLDAKKLEFYEKLLLKMNSNYHNLLINLNSDLLLDLLVKYYIYISCRLEEYWQFQMLYLLHTV